MIIHLKGMDDFIAQLTSSGFQGSTDISSSTLDVYSHDASLFEIRPKLIVFPKNSRDLKILIKSVNAQKKTNKNLSLTARGGGSCMSGGTLNDSIIVDFTKHFNSTLNIGPSSAHVQPGIYYRDFEKATLKYGALMPSFPASRELCTIGGMVANNAGGEKSLKYGKTIDFVTALKVMLADGNEYEVKPLNKHELERKITQKNFEGQMYKQIFKLIEDNYEQIKAAKPRVSKNSTGYNLWDVWDKNTGIFDLTKLFVGSQGTLGLVTEVGFRLVKQEKYSGILVAFVKDMKNLGEIINTVLSHKPTSFESFDNYTLNLSLRFFPYFRKSLGWWGLIKLGISLLPDLLILTRGIPKLILLIEFTGDEQEEVNQKITAAKESLKRFKLEALEEDNTEAKAWKFRIMRRESFNLLRKKVKDKHTAPFIDDLVVPPENLPEFLPKLRKIINKHKLLATVAGHMGEGNFHIIPLMELEKKSERDKLLPAMKEVNELVLKYGGSLSGEHNDGLVRGPWLKQMYGSEVLDLFKKTKAIFDPEDIFNPHKKTDADWGYSYSHIRKNF